ncbi:hypothetical protein PVT67_02905 [Gallaecimonas kandeliae]|uniref:hypothetical protein n=1 Tax=Gallaecimonas kandeliae TaxID=3029055 RepID=UPI002647EEBF|nr:hypothetical protein [Gallaecimonas kandeliae]WKE66212.1 hypothetical protein PVT67_02905 [Gallaecimonas kandeliae]
MQHRIATSWQKLPRWQKLVLGLIFLVAAIMLPELAYLGQLGGMDLLFLAFAVQLGPLLATLATRLGPRLEVLRLALGHSQLARPPVYLGHVACCLFATFLTGSLLSLGIFLPALIMGTAV